MSDIKACQPSIMRKQAGFTLLEIIAALLLLALAFGAVMHVAGAATQVTGHARDLTRLGMWADATLEAAGRAEPLHEGSRDGWYDKHYQWRLTVTAAAPAPGQDPDLHLYRLDLDVSWKDGPDERHARFATLRVQDEPAPAKASSMGAPDA